MTRPEDADRYASYIEDTGSRCLPHDAGKSRWYLTSRPEGDKTEFLTISSEESTRGFAGDDIEAAVFYPEDDQFLVARETFVRHYHVH
jgi:hypothetical protein